MPFLIMAILFLSVLGILFLKGIIVNMIPKEEVPIKVIVHDLESNYFNEKNKYKKTISIIKRINKPEILQIHFHASDTKEHNYWLLNQKGVRINNQYPFFIEEMRDIWTEEYFVGRFYMSTIVIPIYGKYGGASLLYTEMLKEDFLDNFRDSMEYCVYPEIPKSSKHWIVKLEDNWYLYDGHFSLELE